MNPEDLQEEKVGPTSTGSMLELALAAAAILFTLYVVVMGGAYIYHVVTH